ncbi:MAG: hypothetical protein P8Y25_12485, partial [Chromatiaceae bacterium]
SRSATVVMPFDSSRAGALHSRASSLPSIGKPKKPYCLNIDKGIKAYGADPEPRPGSERAMRASNLFRIEL